MSLKIFFYSNFVRSILFLINNLNLIKYVIKIQLFLSVESGHTLKKKNKKHNNLISLKILEYKNIQK